MEFMVTQQRNEFFIFFYVQQVKLNMFCVSQMLIANKGIIYLHVNKGINVL